MSYEDIMKRYANLGVEAVQEKDWIQLLSDELTEIIRKQIDEAGAKATTDLKETIGAVPKVIPNGLEISFSALDYYKFVDEGVNGVKVNRGSRFSYTDMKMPAINDLKNYINVKGIPYFAGDLDSTAYVLARSIQRKGYDARNITDAVFEKGKFEEIISQRVSESLNFGVTLLFENKVIKWQSQAKQNRNQ
jgi:hypothetical protein